MAISAITDGDVASFRENGAVCLRNIISMDWVASLRQAIDANDEKPGPMKRALNRPDQPGAYLDFQLWQRQAHCRRFIFDSPVSEIAAALMDSRQAVLYHDRVRVKEPNTAEGQAWHQDQPFFPIDGSQIVSLWLPLDAESAATGLEFIRGSHRWNRWFQPFRVAQGSAGRYAEDDRFEPVPDIEAERESYDFLSWDTEPGDLIAFHALTLHGAKSKACNDYRCRIWETRWCGDDARYAARAGQITPAIEGHGLRPGDPLECVLFPKVWPR
jgi:ectoine hydroxylase-related dioxygenase (phytanoyl-CoA dioxygenase family)